ncbi:MAG: hypothetical protein ACKOPT_10325, partial [Cyanobium sp.]
KKRGGVPQIRCLHARTKSKVAIQAELEIEKDIWSYRLEFAQDNQRRALVSSEVVMKCGDEILSRPNEEDEDDPSRLSQTFLEQVSANKEFRVIAETLAQIRYLHVIPN